MCGENCCCVFSAKTGTLILIWMTTIFWGIAEVMTIREIFLYCMASSSRDEPKPEKKEPESNYASQLNISLPDVTLSKIDYGPSSTSLSFEFCFYGIMLAMAISGLYASIKKKPTYLIPYFVYRIFWTGLMCLFSIPLIIVEVLMVNNIGPLDYLVQLLTQISFFKDCGDMLKDIISFAEGAILIAILVEILIIILEIHFTSIVYKYYRQLEREEEKARNAIPMSATWSAGKETGIRLSEKGFSCQQLQNGVRHPEV